MPDLYLDWQDDFQASATGDLLLCEGDTQARQRIIRRLLTAVQGYVFHLDYGAGLPQRIGLPGKSKTIAGIVKSQMLKEATVDKKSPPTVTVTESTSTVGLYVIDITYTATSGKQVSLTFDTGN
jgi:hypothetical protein